MRFWYFVAIRRPSCRYSVAGASAPPCFCISNFQFPIWVPHRVSLSGAAGRNQTWVCGSAATSKKFRSRLRALRMSREAHDPPHLDTAFNRGQEQQISSQRCFARNHFLFGVQLRFRKFALDRHSLPSQMLPSYSPPNVCDCTLQ